MGVKMPVKITKMYNKHRVSTPSGIKASGTTKKKAGAQKRLLYAVDHGWEPRGLRK